MIFVFLVPLEQRNLLPEDDTGSVGRLEMWVEIIPLPKLGKIVPVHIFPPPTFKFELRAIVWETRNCVLKDEVEECNVIFPLFLKIYLILLILLRICTVEEAWLKEINKKLIFIGDAEAKEASTGDGNSPSQ